MVRAAMPGALPEALRWRTDKTHFSPDLHIHYNRQLKAARDTVSVGPYIPSSVC